MPSSTKVQTGFLEPQGAFTLDPGTASAPGLKFSTSSATGMFSPSAGVLAFSTGSTQNALTILSGGNVGIGLTSPTGTLDVGSTVSGVTTGDLTVTTGTGTARVTIGRLSSNSSDNTSFRVRDRVDRDVLTADLSNLKYSQVGTDRFIINSSGNVGIGITNPNQKLVVDGVVTASTFISSSYSVFSSIVANDPGANYYSWNNRIGGGLAVVGTTYLNGNVGIGTTIPFTKLDTRGALHVGGGSDGIWLGNAGDNAAYDNVKLYYTGYNSGSPRIYLTPRTQPGSGGVNTYLHLQSNNVPGPGANNMGLIVDGNVGIGAINPLTKLDIRGDILVKNLANVNGSSSIMIGSSIVDGDLSNFGVSIRTVVESEGANSYGMQLFTQQSYLTGQAEKVRITSYGNVGIGVTDPYTKFHVNGNASFSGIQSSPAYIYANGGGDDSTLLIKAGSTAGVWSQIEVAGNWNGSAGIGGKVAFYTGGTERQSINAIGAIIKNQATREYNYSGYVLNNASITIDVPVVDDTSVGAGHKIWANHTHINWTAYGALLECWVSSRGASNQEQINTHNITSGQGGAWTVTKPNATTLRISKSAGSYTGIGYYWVRVVTNHF